MTKAQMEAVMLEKDKEIRQLKERLNDYRAEEQIWEREYEAITAARNIALKDKERAADEGDAYKEALNEGIADILGRLFDYDGNGKVIGFRMDEVEYYCWLAAEPKRT